MNFEVKFTENQKHTTVGFNEGQESIVADFSENQANFDTEFTENQKQSNIQFNETESHTGIDFGTFQTLTGVGITKIEKTTTNGDVDTYTITLTNGKTYFFTVTNGIAGKDGKDGKDGVNGKDGLDGTNGVDGVGILNIAKITTNGNVDTYVITLTNGNTYSFTVTNGENGKDGKDGKDGTNGKDGIDGEDGYTPQKGTDYFTDEDKTEIVEQTKELIDLSSYQTKNDRNLKTDSREIVGAINELNNMLISPTNSVITNLKGTTWLMKEPSEFETPMALGNSTIIGKPYSVNFISNDTEYSSLKISRSYNGSIWWYTLGYDKTYVNDATKFYNYAHKFVTFTGGVDTTNPRLISWVCANCMLLKADIWNVINELNTSIVGRAWVLNDVIDTSQGDFEYVFDFVSNGQKFTGMQLEEIPEDYETNYWVYILRYWDDITGREVIAYTTRENIGWKDEAYRTIITDNLDISLDNIGIKSTTVIANGLATNSKTLVGAVNELKTDVKNVNTDVEHVKMYAENVKHEVVVQAYYNEEDKKWYEDIDFTVVIPNISLFNITLDFNKKDVYFALGKVNLSDWFATEEKHTALANGVNAFQKAYDNTIEKIFGTKNEELETESKIIVGAVNELNKKINSKAVDLTGKTYYIPSGWEVTAEYGQFDVIAFIDGETTKTFEALNLGYASSYKPELYGQALVAYANALVFGKPTGQGVLVDSFTKYSSHQTGFTVTFTGGTDVTNTNLIDWLDTWGELQVPEYQTKTDENLETESKEIPEAINEVNRKTVDKVEYIDEWYNEKAIEKCDEDGIVWNEQFAWLDSGDRLLKSGYIDQRIPIVAGENVTFEVDEENQVVKINATGGGSDESIVGTWVFNEELTFPTLANPDEDNNYYVDFESNNIRFNRFVLGETYMSYYDDVAGRDHDEVYIDGYWQFEELKTITITKEPTDEEFISWLKANAVKQADTPKEEMPQIRFVSMPCSGWFGWVDWTQVNGYQEDSYENLKFTIEIVGGTLQVGDAIQLCRMSQYSGSTSYAPDGTKKYHRPKRKLRRLFEYTVTEEDLEKRFITFEVPWNDKKAIKLFTVWATSGINDKTIYFRIRRPKGEINSGSNGGGMTVDAEFSNVVSIRVYSYAFEWYPTDYGLETSDGSDSEYFYQIRIT